MDHTDPQNNKCDKCNTFLTNIHLNLFHILFKTLLRQIDIKITLKNLIKMIIFDFFIVFLYWMAYVNAKIKFSQNKIMLTYTTYPFGFVFLSFLTCFQQEHEYAT